MLNLKLVTARATAVAEHIARANAHRREADKHNATAAKLVQK